MPDNLTTPVAGGSIIAAKEIGGVKFPQTLLADAGGLDAMGLVAASPAANTILGRLKAIADILSTVDGRVDGLEGLATTLNGLVDGLEALGAAHSTAALQTAGNASLTAISGYLDTVETLQGAGNATLTAIAGYLDSVETLLAAPTPAGEGFIGKIGGEVTSPTAAIAAATTAAYAAGNVIGGKLTFAGASRVATGAGLIQAASVFAKSVQTAAVDLLIFSADPAASTFTDHAALAIAAADTDKLVGVIHLTDWSALGAASVAQALAVGMPFKAAAGTNIYGVLVARGAITLAAANDLTATLRVIPG